MHRAAVQFDNMAEAGGPAAQKKAKAARAAALKSWHNQWRRKYEKVHPLWALANLKGELWGLLWKIIMRNYPHSRKGASGLPIKLQTNSSLNLIPGMDPEEAAALMQRVLDGALERGQLRNECLRSQCFEDMCRHMMEVINMSAGQV